MRGLWKEGAEENIWVQEVLRMKLTREWGELHNKFYNRYCLPNRLSVIKGQRMWWVRLCYFGTNKWWPKFGNQVLLKGYKELNQITETEC